MKEQGELMKLLFVCNQGKYRSKTAQDLFSDKFETESAGIYSENNSLTKNKIVEADIIFVMEENQRKEIAELFPKEYIMKRIFCLEIPDIYNYGDPELKKILRTKINKLQLIKNGY